jgi:hypothetical protein
MSPPERPFAERLKSIQSEPDIWEKASAHAEVASNRKARGGVSIQEIWHNTRTGETIVKHEIYSKDSRVIHSHFRPKAKEQ